MNELIITKDMKNIHREITELDKNQPFDRRMKAYKEAKDEIERKDAEAENLVLNQAKEIIGAEGFEVNENGVFKVKNQSFVIVPYFSYFSGDLSISFSIQDGTKSSNYKSSIYRTGGNKNFKDAVFEEADKLNKYKMETDIDKKNSNSFYKKVKDDITYKPFMYGSDEKGKATDEEWVGDSVNSEYQAVKDYESRCKSEMKFYSKGYSASARLDVKFDNEEDALEFWNKIQDLMKSTKMIKQEER